MKTFLAIVVVAAVVVGGGFIYLRQKDIPAPTTHVEKSLDAQFKN
jgi:hypothetical protein